MTITTASQPKDSAADRESLHQRLWARASADHEMLDALEAAFKYLKHSCMHGLDLVRKLSRLTFVVTSRLSLAQWTSKILSLSHSEPTVDCDG